MQNLLLFLQPMDITDGSADNKMNINSFLDCPLMVLLPRLVKEKVCRREKEFKFNRFFVEIPMYRQPGYIGNNGARAGGGSSFL